MASLRHLNPATVPIYIPHGNRVVFPVAGFTKAQVVEYYVQAAPYMLPHLKDRCVSLKRYPDEAGGEFFWEKDAPAYTPEWVHTFPVWRRNGESQIRYIVVDNVRTLAWAASVGTLEFHPFLSRIPRIEQPTLVAFDLDPGEPAGIRECARVGLLLCDLLARLDLQSYAKVSGSKGIHVYVPLNTPSTYGETQAFARAVAMLLARENPKLIISDMERRQRKGKVFIDWSQNADYKTTVGVYSLRAKRRHPYISMPVTREDLQRAVSSKDEAQLYFSPERALSVLASTGDIFAPVLDLKQRLPEAFAQQQPPTRVSFRPAAAKAADLLHMPSASSQGARRVFSLIKDADAGELRLRLHVHGRLRTWALPDGLPMQIGKPARAIERDDSRNDVPGNGEQTGSFELIEGNAAKGCLDLFLVADKLKGEWMLRRVEGETWAIYRPTVDESGLAFQMSPIAALPAGTVPEEKLPARRESTATTASRKRNSADSALDLSKLPAANPAFVVPMECRLMPEVPDGARWLYELKLDGYRAIAINDGTATHLYSRYGHAFDARFPAIISSLQVLPPVTLDGEVVALDEHGRPSFQELQNSRSTRQPIVYYVFDILNYRGHDLQGLRLEERKRILEKVAPQFKEPVRLAAILHASAPAITEGTRKLGLEGIVAKQRDSIYQSGKRPGSWVKYRVNQREEFIIGGYRRAGQYFDALLVGRFDGDKLMFVDKVKNGFVPETRKQVYEALQDLIIPACPFANLPERTHRRAAVDAEEIKICTWVRPEQKCEVDFAEWTKAGRLRHSSFRALTGRISPRTRTA